MLMACVLNHNLLISRHSIKLSSYYGPLLLVIKQITFFSSVLIVFQPQTRKYFAALFVTYLRSTLTQAHPENTQRREKDHCTAGLQFDWLWINCFTTYKSKYNLLFSRIQTSRTGDQPYIVPLVSVLCIALIICSFLFKRPLFSRRLPTLFRCKFPL